ncbi:uncharacterized protein LOC121729517 [Aricia agestis]|uniref:uncharacterized protein LOC121729517 n=1 Tax=Aricia agestis TaxID=91739 RepID=UPI001C207AFC|nr:uncharacterized protein LOC121729517 [Aricia agestis]XP_041973989.1 uncharacterized protein LOC121729517 [Aricia agestis]
METFIEGVRLQPCIWNPSHPDYRETHIKDEAWHRVIEHYNNSSIPNIHAAKTEWKKLRDNHRDALKRAKLGRNKLLPAHITTWKYAKAMQFLEPHMKYRITENIEMDPPIESTHSTKMFDHDITTSEMSEPPQVGVVSNQPPPKRRCPDRNEFRQDTDALESFFKCILTSTKTMPDWMQTQVKKKIFAVIIEAEEYLSSQRPCVTKNEQPDSLLVEHKIKTEVYTDDSCDNDY